MQAYVTVCKLMDLHASLCNCLQAYVTACKLMDLHAFCILHAYFFCSFILVIKNLNLHTYNLTRAWHCSAIGLFNNQKVKNTKRRINIRYLTKLYKAAYDWRQCLSRSRAASTEDPGSWPSPPVDTLGARESFLERKYHEDKIHKPSHYK